MSNKQIIGPIRKLSHSTDFKCRGQNILNGSLYRFGNGQTLFNGLAHPDTSVSSLQKIGVRASAVEEVVFRSVTAGSELILVGDRRRPFDRSAIYALVDDTGFWWESGTTAKKYFTRGESAEVKKQSFLYIYLFNKVSPIIVSRLE